MAAEHGDKTLEVITFRQFLEGIPPGKTKTVSDLVEGKYNGTGRRYYTLRPPVLNLYCDTPETCEGLRLFTSQSESVLSPKSNEDRFLSYVCKNCSASTKSFALRALMDSESSGIVFKYGELPSFGPPVPARLLRLLGEDARLFLKGRTAENQGLGIAAFAYYRRVVESQKDALFEEIIRVSKALGADSNVIASLVKGKADFRFTGAVEKVKVAIPPALMVNGYNPLTLLHAAFSRGLHAGTDAECLTDATSARIVLVDMVLRMAEVMKDDAGLKSAVSRLANFGGSQLPLTNRLPDTK